MRIGRLAFGKAKGKSCWGYTVGPCECLILDLGMLYVCWTAKTCKCLNCEKYDCICRCPLCAKTGLKCKCEKFR